MGQPAANTTASTASRVHPVPAGLSLQRSGDAIALARPRTARPTGDRGRHNSLIDPAAEPQQAAEASPAVRHGQLRNATALAAAASARTFCATSTSSSIDLSVADPARDLTKRLV